MQRFLPLMFVALAATLAAQPSPLDQLLKNSPFGTARPGSPSEATGSGQAWEFRGLVEENGVLWFSLYEPATRRSVWRRLQQPDQHVVVRQFDPDGNTLTIEFQSRTLVLPMRSAPRIEGPPVASQPSGVQPATVASAPPAAPADNAQRLQQIAEEIRRRRALRQQTLQNTQSNPPTARP